MKTDKNFNYNFVNNSVNNDINQCYRKFLKKYSSKYGQHIPEYSLITQNLGYASRNNPINLVDSLEILICSVLLIPRLILLIVFGVLIFFFLFLSSINMPREYLNKPPTTPNSIIRRSLVRISFVFVRMALFFCFGMYYIKVNGKPATQKEAPIRLFVPHYSFLDALSLNYLFPHNFISSPVMKKEVADLLNLRALESIPVDRNNQTGKDAVTEELKRRSTGEEAGKWFPVLIAPEGTAMNGLGLLVFKLGAFTPGVPVQPVHLVVGRENRVSELYSNDTNKVNKCCSFFKSSQEFGNSYGRFIHGNQRISDLKMMLTGLMTFYTPATINYLDTITPTPAEKNDPILFSENVRSKIANAINLPKLDVCWEDLVFQEIIHAEFKEYNPIHGMVKFHKLRCLYQAKFKSLQKFYFEQYLGKFSSSDQQNDNQRYNFQAHFLKDENGKPQPLIKKQDLIKILDIKENSHSSSAIEITRQLDKISTWPEILNLAEALEIWIVCDKSRGIDIISKRIDSEEALQLEQEYQNKRIWKRQSSVAVWITNEDGELAEPNSFGNSFELTPINRPKTLRKTPSITSSYQTLRDLSTRVANDNTSISIRKSIAEIVEEEDRNEVIYKRLRSTPRVSEE